MIQLKKLKEALKEDSDTIDEYKECIADIIKNETVLRMDNYIQHGSITTLEHCIHVSYYSFMLCRYYELDYRSAARAALLHDLFLYDWHEKRPKAGWHAFTHALCALKNAEIEFSLNKKEKDIIKKHMWPVNIRLPRYRETLIVSFVDKYCACIEAASQLRRKKIKQT